MQSSPLSKEKYVKDAGFCWSYFQTTLYLGFVHERNKITSTLIRKETEKIQIGS